MIFNHDFNIWNNLIFSLAADGQLINHLTDKSGQDNSDCGGSLAITGLKENNHETFSLIKEYFPVTCAVHLMG